MKLSALKYGILSATAAIIICTILLMPFHALLTVWLGSNLGHYTAFRLWKEGLLAVAALGAVYLVVFDRKVRLQTLYHELSWLIIAYAGLSLLLALGALYNHTVSPKAAAYGLLVDVRFLLFFLVAWVIGGRTKRLDHQWSKLLIWPALVVIAFGLLQIVLLPADFLRHFGYGQQTIPPYETINHNAQYIRVMSTLRGANPLGAYLIMPIAGLTVLMGMGKRNWRRALTLLGAITVLFFSFSRSAWIGAILATTCIYLVQTNRLPTKKWLAILAGTGLVILVAGTVTLRHNPRYENIIFHTQTHSAIKTNSNEGHLAALKDGLRSLAHQPLGEGPGTAGPASVYNTKHAPRIAEDYFIQIGQEVGWLGLVLFLAINGFLGVLLWHRRADPLALTLLASLVGISFVNLLSHAWADDTLAYVWWGLAGIAIGSSAQKADNEAKAQ